MKFFKKILIPLLIFIFSMSLIGCTKNEDNKISSSTTNSEEITTNTFPEFNAKTIDGKNITNNIFKDKKLTVINIWGTFCRPCLNELPYLEEISNEMKSDDVNIIGIIIDGNENKENAANILKKLNITYPNIIPSEDLVNNYLNKFNAIPVTLLVDKNQNIIGNTIVGAKTKEEYKSIINDALKKLS